jgi:hypothetical protein
MMLLTEPLFDFVSGELNIDAMGVALKVVYTSDNEQINMEVIMKGAEPRLQTTEMPSGAIESGHQ